MGGEAFFEDVPLGSYIVEVTAPGYQIITEEIEILSAQPRVPFFITLLPERSGLGIPAVPPGPPLLTPKARKALDQALEALRGGDLEKAGKRLEAARKLAPNHPDVSYLLGMLSLQRNNLPEAQSHLEKALTMYPRHGAARAALGEIFLRRGDLAQAVSNLEQALAYEPDTWQARGLLAAIYLRQNQPEKARPHAQRAVELTKGKVPGFRLLLARVLAGLGKTEAAALQLRSLLQDHPDAPDSAEARRLLSRLSEPRPGPAPAPGTQPAAVAGAAPVPAKTLLPLPRARNDWAPPEVDDVPPAVASDVACSLPEVLANTARQVQALANSLERFTATERILYEELNQAGATTYWEDRTVNYVVSIRRPRPDVFSVEEYRAPRGDGEFNPRIASTGLVALALLFHPLYSGDFDMKCAGLGQWQGHSVWIVEFRQRPDRPARVRTYRTAVRVFGIGLKGRAWIDANSSHIVRLETDLVEPVQEARLARDHLVIEYGPVQFTKENSSLWLPSRAELHSLFRDRWYRVRHTLGDYLLFSIETRDKIAPPPQQP